jgi:hypothetical protein
MYRITVVRNEYKIEQYANNAWFHVEYVELSVDTVIDMVNASARGGYFYCSEYTIMRSEDDE